MNPVYIIRTIFIVSSIVVLALGGVVYARFASTDHLLVVYFDVERGIATGSIADILRVIVLAFFFQVINLAVFRMVYVRNRALGYFLPALNAVIALLILMYGFVIIALN